MPDISQSTALDSQLDLYERQAESWKEDHARAMACLDFEVVLKFGMFLFESIQETEEQWLARIASGETEMREADAAKIQAWYTYWLHPCNSVLRQLSGFEDEGFAVKQANEFREACDTTRAKVRLMNGETADVKIEESTLQKMSQMARIPDAVFDADDDL